MVDEDCNEGFSDLIRIDSDDETQCKDDDVDPASGPKLETKEVWQFALPSAHSDTLAMAGIDDRLELKRSLHRSWILP